MFEIMTELRGHASTLLLYDVIVVSAAVNMCVNTLTHNHTLIVSLSEEYCKFELTKGDRSVVISGLALLNSADCSNDSRVGNRSVVAQHSDGVIKSADYLPYLHSVSIAACFSAETISALRRVVHLLTRK